MKCDVSHNEVTGRGDCAECARARVKLWRKANPEKARKQSREAMARRREHGDQTARDREWVKSNPEKRRAIQRHANAKHYAAHREEVIARVVAFKKRKREEARRTLGKMRFA